MPVIESITCTKSVSINGFAFNYDGTVTLTVVTLLADAGGNAIQQNTEPVMVSASDASAILDTTPTVGLTRRQDVGVAFYAWLISKGLAAGTVT